MNRPTPLFDRTALALHRTRASDRGAMFLHDIAADEIEERLNEVKRTFTDIVVVTGHPDVWRDRFPGARVIPDGETLDLEEASADLVVHAMALHWAEDPVGQLVQARRALRPDGLFIAAAFGGRTLAELRAVLAETEAALTGGLSPRVAPMGEIRDLGGLLQRAGFALPVADSLPQQVRYETLFHLVRDLRGMGETNALADRSRRTPGRAFFAEAARRYADAFSDGDGRITATFELVFLTGWAPDASQPKPLRPGSATARLADALGTAERPAGDPIAPGED